MQTTCNHQALHSLFFTVRRRKATTPAAVRGSNQSQSKLILYNFIHTNHTRFPWEIWSRGWSYFLWPSLRKAICVIGKIDFTSFLCFWCLITTDTDFPFFFKVTTEFSKKIYLFQYIQWKNSLFQTTFLHSCSEKKIKVVLLLWVIQKGLAKQRRTWLKVVAIWTCVVVCVRRFKWIRKVCHKCSE